MDDAQLIWRDVVIEDPDGGKIILWPHLPCILMPKQIRSRKIWDGLALLLSNNDFLSMKDDDVNEKKSPGANVEAAISSGTQFGKLLKILRELDIDGPHIPDPEPMRLVTHAQNARGGLPIYLIEPDISEEKWVDWLSRSADMQVRISSLLSRLTSNRRWKKDSTEAISKIRHDRVIDTEMGAASANCFSWNTEEERVIGRNLSEERDMRFASRIRGALADLRNSRVDVDESSQPLLMVPVHQARLPSIQESILAWPEPETIRRME
tara:strand:+ start:38515 stop:39312 length:798 start_codon:yes stop_codon:yes gene_type:complete